MQRELNLFVCSVFAQEKVLKPLADKKVVMIIAHTDFRDEEYQTPKEILSQAGAKVTTASSSLEIAKGMLGAKVKPDILVSDIKVKEYDVIIFVGGIGAQEYWDDPTAQRIAQEAVKENKVLGAICIAPVILANAGVLKDKKATVFSTVKDKLKAKGAKYSSKPVEKSGKIITAQSPKEAKPFAEQIKKTLLEK